MIDKSLPLVGLYSYNCRVDFVNYRDNNRIALNLICDNGEDYACATVNLPMVPLEPDEVIIKDYSENEGVLDALVTAGYISMPLRYIQSGFVAMPVCKLLVKPKSNSKKGCD